MSYKVHLRRNLEGFQNFKFAFFLNLIFALIELIGAFFTNSVAIASDAIHDLGDSVALGASWYLERYAQKGPDQYFSFGYQRFSLLSAVLNGFILISGSVLVLRETVPRIWTPPEVQTTGMVYLAILGIFFNGYAAWKLNQGHSHNESILSLHFVEDLLGWIAILIIACMMQIGNFAFLDPVLSLLIACFVLWNAIKRLKITLKIFLQSLPDDLEIAIIENRVFSCPGVLGMHDTHIWSLDGRHHVLSTHVVIKNDLARQDLVNLKCRLRQDLNRMGIVYTTLELEFSEEICDKMKNLESNICRSSEPA